MTSIRIPGTGRGLPPDDFCRAGLASSVSPHHVPSEERQLILTPSSSIDPWSRWLDQMSSSR